VALPTLEPRGAVSVELKLGKAHFRAIGVHLDLSGLRRKHQVRSLLDHVSECENGLPAVLLGDFNEWSMRGGSVREFGSDWRLLAPGKSFPSRRPVAPLDRIAHSKGWKCTAAGVHHSALAARASDHLPVWAELEFSA
jgi:endonuclease/exonuclease/phosphatase family metal-dependent hydrolase